MASADEGLMPQWAGSREKRMAMTLREKCCRGAIFGSRFLAVLTLLPAVGRLPALPRLDLSVLLRLPFREIVVMTSLLAWFAYSLIVILPLERASGKVFVALSIAGIVSALMSLKLTGILYWGICADLLRGKLVFYVMAGALLLLFYSYLPVVVCLRKISRTKTSGSADGSGPEAGSLD